MFDRRTGRAETLLARLREGSELTLRERDELVWRLALPSLIAHVTVLMMQYIDASMVGHLGAAQSAAVGLVSSPLWLFGGVTGALSMGFTVQVAHRVGARDDADARAVARQGLSTGLLFALLMAALALAVSDRIPGWLGGDPVLAPEASGYFRVLAAFLPVLQLSWCANGLMRASGDMRTPAQIGMAMCGLDVILNWWMIFPPLELSLWGHALTLPRAGLGVSGAAWGTVLAECIAAALSLSFLIWRRGPLRLRDEGLVLSWRLPVLRRALAIALPFGAERVLMCSAQIFSMAIVAPLGIVSVAAHTLAVTAESLCYMPGFGLAEAATTLVGQSVGARRLGLARSLAWRAVLAGMAVMGVGGLALFLASDWLMSLMTSDPRVVALGGRLLRVEAFAEPLYAAAIVSAGAFVGAGNSLLAAGVNLSSMWFLRLTAAWFMAARWGVTGVWLAMSGELMIRGLVFLAFLRGGLWLRRRLPGGSDKMGPP